MYVCRVFGVNLDYTILVLTALYMYYLIEYLNLNKFPATMETFSKILTSYRKIIFDM
jgi:hypothetical protein